MIERVTLVYYVDEVERDEVLQELRDHFGNSSAALWRKELSVTPVAEGELTEEMEDFFSGH